MSDREGERAPDPGLNVRVEDGGSTHLRPSTAPDAARQAPEAGDTPASRVPGSTRAPGVEPDPEYDSGSEMAPEELAGIDRIVAEFVDDVSSLDVQGEEYRLRVADIDGLGEREILATSEMSGRLLDRPVQAMEGFLEGKAPLARRLVELRHAVDDLNPARYQLSSRRSRRMFGLIPARDRVRDYFDRYWKAQGHLQDLVAGLGEGRMELERDNAALMQVERSLWTEMETLRQYAVLGQRLDEALQRRLDEIQATDPGRARALRNDVLFAVRRRRREILTQLAVASQGYAALRLIEENNAEVIRAIGSATTTTVAALRTAVTVSRALLNQRRLTEQLRTMNEGGEDAAEAGIPARGVAPAGVPGAGGVVDGGPDAGAMVTAEGATVGDDLRSRTTARELAALQRAWEDVFVALDEIEAYKLRALDAMQASAGGLAASAEHAGTEVGARTPTPSTAVPLEESNASPSPRSDH